MRLFVALNLPEPEKRRLWAATASLRASGADIRWTPVESIHLTLRFLGEVGEADVDRLRGRLERIAAVHPPFALRIGGVGGFPTLRRARVWWLGIEPVPALGALQTDVESAMADEGFRPEDRPFAAHLTIGRAARGARPVPAATAEQLAAGIDFTATWPIETLDLMRSHLRRDGARYEAIARSPLGATVMHAPDHARERDE